MAIGSSMKNMCSVTSIVYLIFLLMITQLIASHFYSIQRPCYQNRLMNQDHDRPKIGMDLDQPTEYFCRRSHIRYDICSINGPTALDPTKAALYSIGPIGPNSSFEKVRPYPRKWEPIMDSIREVTLISGPTSPKCKVHHNSPAVLFSAGGFTNNFFHAFADGFIPLYITLKNHNLTDRDVILVVDQAHDWWAHKYAELIRAFTKHPIIKLEKETSTHCFTSAVVGLVTHGPMVVDPKARPGPIEMSEFHSFLRNAYRQQDDLQGLNNLRHQRRPRLVWVDRAGAVGRVILNQDEARTVAEEVGFDVVIYKPTNSFSLHDAYELLDGSHALIGAHGAGMTHLLFLRPGSVVVQIVPLALEWLGDRCFGEVSRESGLVYMDYELGYNESTLSSKYEKDDPIFRDAKGLILEKGWVWEVMGVLLTRQNVKLDLVKFRSYMKEVHEKAKRFMELYG